MYFVGKYKIYLNSPRNSPRKARERFAFLPLS